MGRRVAETLAVLLAVLLVTVGYVGLNWRQYRYPLQFGKQILPWGLVSILGVLLVYRLTRTPDDGEDRKGNSSSSDE